MKLKRFTRNKKQKEILIGSIVGILLIIGGISLYRTFALYKEEKSFNVLRGKVPDFSGRDIILSYTIDGGAATELKGFPSKNTGYVVNKVECDNKVTADWNDYDWGLINIENPNESKQIKCNVDFRKSTLNGAEPVLKGDLVAVEIDNAGKVTKADTSKEWYNYDKKEWANAIIPTSAAKAEVDASQPGTSINEDQIESYFVWIPKYSYKLFDDNLGDYTGLGSTVTDKGSTTAIEIRFGVGNTTDNEEKEECATPMRENKVQGLSGGKGTCEKGKWMTHPAFLAFNTTGLWVGKFEPHNGGGNSIQIKPNVTSWGSITIGNSYTYSKNYKKELQSHLMKNTEWGAVAYLTQSIYGKCDKQDETTTSCEEVTTNSNNSYLTGYSGTTTPYTNPESVASSTTKNYSGIYDMSGGVLEQMASVMLDNNNINPLYSNTGLDATSLNDARYYDVYNYGTENQYQRRILGDATGEMGPFALSGSAAKGSFFGDWARFIQPNAPWFYRSSLGTKTDGMPGIFAFDPARGESIPYNSFRIVLAPK